MNALAIILAIALAGVVLALVVGVIAMARGGEFNRKHGNTMMRLRVGLQGLAVVLVLLFVFVASQNG
ncbi:MAG: twin transmembrane helix small protein [Alphaproteobacteria bacterium]|nr:twin transmembrane helix small protein [Alphaproteobacteria bacterium]